MKKIYKISMLASLLGLVGGGLAGVHAYRGNAKEAKAELTNEVTINESFFVGHKTLTDAEYTAGFDSGAGRFEPNVDKTYWAEGYYYQGMSQFFDGCNNAESGNIYEKWTGYLKSKSWTQTNRYIYFTWGCASDFTRGDDAVKLIVHAQQGSGTEYTWDVFNNTFCGVAMVYRYFEVPKDVYSKFGGNSFTMWIEFYDGRVGDYGAHVFGWLHTDQNFKGVMDGANAYYNAIRTPMQENIKYHFDDRGGNWELRCALGRAVNTDFDSAANFYYDFQYDSAYDQRGDSYDDNDAHKKYRGNNDWPEGRHLSDVVISTAYSRGDDNGMPYNKTGNGFFRGWYDDGPGGYVASDVPTYRFISRPFVLNSVGLVSIKMAGGGASLHVIDHETGEDLAYIDIDVAATLKDHSTGRTHEATAFNVNGDEGNIALSGKNTVTMVRHIINLDQYVGRVLRVGIADVVYDGERGGWGSAYFDELVTEYDKIPQFKVDSVCQANATWSHYQDIFVNSTPIGNDINGIKYTNNAISHTDNSAVKKAYDFLVYYFDTFRTSGASFSRCDVDATQLLQKYDALTPAAQEIVDDAQDFDCSNRGTNAWYQQDVVRSDDGGAFTVGRAIQDFKDKAGGTTSSFMPQKTVDETTSTIVIFVVIAATVSILALAVLMIRKRKENQ